jgi:hypothetical protein
MKKTAPIIVLTAVLSLLAGILLSRMSFVARTAISVFHRHYRYYTFMKTWWKGALIFFGILILLLVIQLWMKRTAPPRKAAVFQIICLLLAIGGLYFTYRDFRHTLSHRWAGENLHLGFYLFWINWAIISVYVMFRKKTTLTAPGNKGGAMPQTTPYTDLADDK